VRGLLIVNADDFGGNRLATDRIAECFAAGAITSTTAMVYMGDSPRAAEIARERQLPVGLHLNVTQELEDPDAPALVRERQSRLVRYFAGRRLRRFTFNPAINALARRCIEDQLECFRELFGHEPIHIDGHNHGHLSPSVLLALPRGVHVRTGQSGPDAKSGGVARRARRALIAHRQGTTEYFLPIDRLGASPSEHDIEELLAVADRASLEVMVHPDRDDDFTTLMSDAWKRALQRRNLGTYEQL
jgi:predicted glycoside hydrolase/deacetylase ChbG (UPF0249 family)